MTQTNRNTEYYSDDQYEFDERDYEDIYYHFDDYSQDLILANASKFMTPPEPAEHYEWEEVILDEISQSEWEGMKKSFYFGMGCGLSSFGMLRWRRARGGLLFGGMSRYASRASTSSSSRPTGAGGYTFDALPSKKPNGGQFHHHQYANSSSTNSRSGFVIDMTLSTLLGLGTSLLAIEKDLFYPTANANNPNEQQQHQSPPSYAIEPPPQWISPSIPLVPGRSVIADTLCRPLTEEFRKFPKRMWQNGNHKGIEGNGYDNNNNNHTALYANSGWRGTKYHEGSDSNAPVVNSGENNADVSTTGGNGDNSTGDANRQEAGVYERLVLDNLQGFVINCERRARQERKLRKIKGMREGAPVVIPEVGVSADEDLDLSDVYYESECDDDDDDDDNYDTGFGL